MLHANTSNQVSTWSEDFGSDTVLLHDDLQTVYFQYKEDGGRPQYVVIDRDMTIVLKTTNQNDAEFKVLELLE